MIDNRDSGQPAAPYFPKYLTAEINVDLKCDEFARINYYVDGEQIFVKFYKDSDPTIIGVKITVNDAKEVKFYDMLPLR